MGTYILGGSNTNDDTGVLNAQGDVNALANVIVTNDLTVNGTASITGDSTLASTTATSLNVSDTLTSPNINASSSPLNLQVAGSTVATLDSSGDLTTNGWAYIKGRNRIYQQNLTAFTTTSTTGSVLINSANKIIPKFSGHIIIEGIFRVSNNTVGDGIHINLTINGSTVDSETYTQEGLASNEHTMVFHYELTSQAIGTSITIGFQAEAITGGTASAKMVSFICEEI